MSRHTIRLTSLAFVLLYLVSVFTPTLPEGAYSDGTVLGLYDDAATRWRTELAGLALAGAALAVLAFVGQVLRASGASRDAWGGRMAAATATLYAAMLGVAATAFAAVSVGVNVGEVPVESVGADTARVLTILGFYALLVPGSIAAGATIAALSRTARVAGILPAWCARLGYALGALCLVPAWPSQFLPVLWVLVAGLALDPRRQPRTEATAPEPVAA